MLDKLITRAIQGMGEGGQQGASPLLQMIASLLSSNGQFGGLGGLLQQFQQAGMGDQMSSWVSTGPNLPIDLQQLTQVFGQERMQQMAGQVGMEPQDFGSQLSQLLPQMVDQLTPQGRLPEGGIDDALGSLSQLLR